MGNVYNDIYNILTFAKIGLFTYGGGYAMISAALGIAIYGV
jgi:chromate transport protein ChrA